MCLWGREYGDTLFGIARQINFRTLLCTQNTKLIKHWALKTNFRKNVGRLLIFSSTSRYASLSIAETNGLRGMETVYLSHYEPKSLSIDSCNVKLWFGLSLLLAVEWPLFPQDLHVKSCVPEDVEFWALLESCFSFFSSKASFLLTPINSLSYSVSLYTT